MINDLKKDAELRMGKSIDSLRHELTKLRTGRAHTSLLDHVMVSYYGNDTPLNQVANVGVADARTLMISPWEKGMVQAIEKAIMAANLGLTPNTAGTVDVRSNHQSKNLRSMLACLATAPKTSSRLASA